VALQQEIGHGKVQYRIAQKLQSLVVIGGVAPVRQGTFKQARPLKMMT
jgi:hypothetical protein